MFDVKGYVDYFDQLPLTGVANGDVYVVNYEKTFDKNGEEIEEKVDNEYVYTDGEWILINPMGGVSS